MSNFIQCETCGNDKQGNWLYNCNSCSKSFCDSCQGKDSIQTKQCPHCKSKNIDYVAQMHNKIINENNQLPVETSLFKTRQKFKYSILFLVVSVLIFINSYNDFKREFQPVLSIILMSLSAFFGIFSLVSTIRSYKERD